MPINYFLVQRFAKDHELFWRLLRFVFSCIKKVFIFLFIEDANKKSRNDEKTNHKRRYPFNTNYRSHSKPLVSRDRVDLAIREFKKRDSFNSRIRERFKDQELLRAKVKMVLDGDTIDVYYKNGVLRIRLSAIDSPEGTQPWGKNAKGALIGLVGGREVLLATYGLDVHNRTVATVYIEKEEKMINVNERMVVCGHAWVERRYYFHLPRERQRRLNKLEQWAKSKKVGLWKSENPTAPWLWRDSGTGTK